MANESRPLAGLRYSLATVACWCPASTDTRRARSCEIFALALIFLDKGRRSCNLGSGKFIP
jgi:hypothetical protein